jgi:hypothetical protein
MKKMNWGDQKGMALVVALIILLVLTLLGISSINSTIFESKISGNERWGSAAFYAAKGGVDVGIARLPDTTPYLGNIGSDQTYRSGRMTPAVPQPLISYGLMLRPGFETAWEFKRFQVNSTGESFGTQKEIEVQVLLGPYPAGTSYNN